MPRRCPWPCPTWKKSRQNQRSPRNNPSPRKCKSRRRSVRELFCLLRLSQFGKPPGPQNGDQNGARTTQNHCRYGAKPVSGETGFELAELVRSANENGIHRVDAAAHFIGRAQLDEQLANHDADHVARSYQKERKQGDEEVSGNSEKEGGQAESGDAPQHS